MNKKELNYLLYTIGIFKNQQLDSNLNINDDTHFTDSFDKTNEIITNELTESEIQLAIMAKQTEFLKSIKNMLFFFTTITVIGIVVMLFSLLTKFS